jgi:hypothetical protein
MPSIRDRVESQTNKNTSTGGGAREMGLVMERLGLTAKGPEEREMGRGAERE